MNAAHHIAQAEKALHTGQPTLATRHMQRALQYAAQARAQPDKDYKAAQARLRTHTQPSGFLDRLGRTIPIVDFIQAASKALDTNHHRQADYALAGPSKGTPS